MGASTDFATTLREYHPFAEKWGDGNAQFILGAIYEEGIIVPKDCKNKVKWHMLAAEQEYAPAQFSLGAMYRDGQGVPKNYKKAMEWLLRKYD